MFWKKQEYKKWEELSQKQKVEVLYMKMKKEEISNNPMSLFVVGTYILLFGMLTAASIWNIETIGLLYGKLGIPIEGMSQSSLSILDIAKKAFLFFFSLEILFLAYYVYQKRKFKQRFDPLIKSLRKR